MALGLLFAQGKEIERVGQRFGETIEARRVRFELAQAIGTGEGDGAHEIKSLLGYGDQTGAAIARVGADDAEVETTEFVDGLA